MESQGPVWTTSIPLHGPPAEEVELAPGITALKTVTVTRKDDQRDHDVSIRFTHDGVRYICEEVVFRRRPGGPPVTSEGMRDVQLRAAKYAALEMTIFTSTGEGRAKSGFEVPAEVVDQPRPTIETYRWVGAVYLVNEAISEPPAKAVADVFEVSPATAGRYIRQAKKLGYIPAPEA